LAFGLWTEKAAPYIIARINPTQQIYSVPKNEGPPEGMHFSASRIGERGYNSGI
jgi:hypothetical protein